MLRKMFSVECDKCAKVSFAVGKCSILSNKICGVKESTILTANENFSETILDDKHLGLVTYSVFLTLKRHTKSDFATRVICTQNFQ